MTKDKRKHPRTAVHIEVELSHLDDTVRTVITRDISQGGLFMQLNNPEHYIIGEMVSINYENPLDNFAATYHDAIIVRVADDGIAVAFIEIDES